MGHAKAFLLCYWIGLKFILHSVLISNSDYKERKPKILSENMKKTCRKSRLRPWESRNLWDVLR